MSIQSLQLDSHSNTPLYKQLIENIKQEINQGDLAAGSKLPSIRNLASSLAISRITVENAYSQLLEEGYIISKPQVGYYAADLKDLLPFNPIPEPASAKLEPLYNFRNSSVDSSSFNPLVWRRYINQALRNKDLLISYGQAQGEAVLRNTLAKYSYESRDVKCTPQQIVVGAGVQSLLHILCGVLKSSQLKVIGIQSPGFFHAEQVFNDHGFKTLPFSLEQINKINIVKNSKSKPGMVCINPSDPYAGKALPAAKRLELLRWAHLNNTYILEDDYIGEFRYLMRPIPSLQGMSNGNNVIYLGSFSRTLMPSLRISYMVLPLSLLSIYQNIKNNYNQTSSSLEQLALANFINDGHLRRHIRRLRKLYAHKNQALRQSLQQVFGKKITITSYESGLRLLLLVDSPFSSQELATKALDHGVAIIPVTKKETDNKAKEKRLFKPQVMLSYAGIPETDILVAVQALYKAWFS